VAQGPIPFKMRSSKNRPKNVLTAVRFYDYWFYVDHADITSKRALSLIILLFRLQAPTPAGAAPTLTLPTDKKCQNVTKSVRITKTIFFQGKRKEA
jgi:hypothetical protein